MKTLLFSFISRKNHITYSKWGECCFFSISDNTGECCKKYANIVLDGQVDNEFVNP